MENNKDNVLVIIGLYLWALIFFSKQIFFILFHEISYFSTMLGKALAQQSSVNIETLDMPLGMNISTFIFLPGKITEVPNECSNFENF